MMTTGRQRQMSSTKVAVERRFGEDTLRYIEAELAMYPMRLRGETPRDSELLVRSGRRGRFARWSRIPVEWDVESVTTAIGDELDEADGVTMEAIEMYYWGVELEIEELSWSEVAAACGCSKATVLRRRSELLAGIASRLLDGVAGHTQEEVVTNG